MDHDDLGGLPDHEHGDLPDQAMDTGKIPSEELPAHEEHADVELREANLPDMVLRILKNKHSLPLIALL